jgi:alpha-L-fucosidase
MTNYGKIDVLWYDVAWPLETPALWESAKMTAMVRRLQPDIIVNNRSLLPEDFGTPEEEIKAEPGARAWEACMTFNGSWGYFPNAPAEDWHSTREVIRMLRTVTAGGGNLLLNIGPAPDGSVPALAYERLLPVGRWLSRYGEALYGRVDRAMDRLDWIVHGDWTLKGNTVYYWTGRWVGSEIVFGGFRTKLRRATLMGLNQEVTFEQSKDRLVLRGLPEKNPDEIAGYAMIRLEFEGRPRQELGAGCVIIRR